ncbi:MAG: class I SAM-dependent methyltransferase [Oscillospiraceae bacterium]
MDKKNVVEFFDRLAPQWDDDMVRDEDVINTILNNAGITKGVSVLDVACGTGVLIPDYLIRNVSSVIGVDISANMIRLAKEKFSDPRVTFICADAETSRFEEVFDRCVIYNAFPHFPSPYLLMRNLASCLKTGGILTIAHGLSRQQIDSHHMEHASSVSVGLMSDDELSALLSPYFDVVVTISDDRMQQITGIKR